jgi:hypothetical protein
LRGRLKKVRSTHPSKHERTPFQKRHRALAVPLPFQKAQMASPKGSAGSITVINSTARLQLFKLNPNQTGPETAHGSPAESDSGTSKIRQYRMKVASRYPIHLDA